MQAGPTVSGTPVEIKHTSAGQGERNNLQKVQLKQNERKYRAQNKIKWECEKNKENLNKQGRAWRQWALLLMESASSGAQPLTPKYRLSSSKLRKHALSFWTLRRHTRRQDVQPQSLLKSAVDGGER
jgi:hypothetical protein